MGVPVVYALGIPGHGARPHPPIYQAGPPSTYKVGLPPFKNPASATVFKSAECDVSRVTIRSFPYKAKNLLILLNVSVTACL